MTSTGSCTEGTSLHAARALLPSGWARDVRVTFDGNGGILAVAVDTAVQQGDQRLADRVLLPAPSNLHSHAFQRALAGRTQRRGTASQDSFWTWRKQMYEFLDVLTPDMIEAISAQAQIEMLESGYAAAAEFHYVHHAPGGTAYENPAEMAQRVMNAASATGIGLLMLPVLYSAAGATTAGALASAPSGGQLRFACDLDRYERLWESARTALAAGPTDWRIGIAPHSLRAVPRDVLSAVIDAHPDGPVHMHIAEQVAEVEAIRAAWGATPVAWLAQAHEIDERWCLVHATHLTNAESDTLAASGATVGLCPITEADLGDGLFPAADYLEAGGRFGIGTDSNVRITLAGELRLLEYGQRLTTLRRNVLVQPGESTGRTLYNHVLDGGSRALARRSGAIEAGYVADLLTLDTSQHGDESLHGLDGDDLLDAWIFSATGSVVSDVWSAGRHVVAGGRHVKRDATSRRYRAAMDTLVKCT